MMRVDGLLIFQASSCNHQIPAKIYEYLRAGKPIFALTDPAGDTAGVLNGANIQTICPLDDKDAIKDKFITFLKNLKTGTASIADDESVKKYSREAMTSLLANLLNT